MLTRRQVLTGTAAASIAAIASAHGIATAEAAANAGFDVGFGNLAGGAVTAFQKEQAGFSFFMKWTASAVQVFYKETTNGIGVYGKIFPKVELGLFSKDWTAWRLLNTLTGSLADGQAGFYKVQSNAAQLFLKYTDLIGESVEDVIGVDSQGVFDLQPGGFCYEPEPEIQ